ncbi:MAG: hypothetical protein IJ762_07585, partial [Bacteroidaceae bacterium]|nr:hypothetical protein [Bacteroidaceae bacterium]
DNEVGGIVGNNEWKVENCRVSGTIVGHDAREIGGIAGLSRNAGSYIRNCWVSADISSDWTNKAVFYGTELGGIVGLNSLTKIQYCCMTGNVTNHDRCVGGIVGLADPREPLHCTFYGTRISNHSHKNPYMGAGDGDDPSEMHGAIEFNDLSSDEGLNAYLSRIDPQYSIYRYAVQYPFAVNVKNEGNGAIVSSVDRARPGQTVTLTRTWGTSWTIYIKDADGKPIEFTRNNNVYTFTMPRRDVNVIATFTSESQLLKTAGTEDDPYSISSTELWNEFVWRVNHGNSFSGKYLRLDADITIATTAGLYGDNPFSGTFLGNGHTLTANLSSTTTGTGWNEEGVAPFHYIKDATIKDLTVAGTIASASYHTAGIVGFAFGTNLIEGCTVTATLNQNNNYAGGIIGHGENSATTIKDCVFAGTINGVGGKRANIGGFWGWSDTGSPVFQNCLEAGTYHNISSMHPMGLHGASATISGGFYYLNPQIGSPDQVSTVTGATQVSFTEPTGELYQTHTINGRDFHITCTISGNDVYAYTGNDIAIDEPTVTGIGGTALTKGSDYTYTISPSPVKEKGVYTVTFHGNGSTCYGTKTVQIYVLDGNVAGTLNDGKYMINADVTVEDRITISGNVVLHLGEGATLTAQKGIELSTGNTLTIEGKGALTINGCDDGKSGIGAKEAGTLVINGGNITVKGGYHAAALGGDGYNTDGGSITINGGVVRATGGTYAAGIGGGHGNPSYQTPDGLCGDIVIKGGQVYACGGNDAPGIGAGAKSLSPNFKAGTLTLSWTNPDDYIHSTNTTPSKKGFAVNSITFAEGKQFLFYGTSTIVTADNIEGGKIVPYVNGLPGEGTEENPYTIRSAEEWGLFADAVYAGNDYSGKVVKLTEDISVTAMAGTDNAHSFQGTFDGNGKTLTFNNGSAESPFTEEYCAPFRHVKNATIKDLYVGGTIYTSAKKAAGIVGESHGALTLTGCRSSVSIHSSVSGDGTHGGLVSTLSGADNDVTIDGCVFDGSFATTGGTTNCGGFIGWPVYNTPAITNSLMKPVSVDAGMLGNTFARWHTTYEPTVTNCYYVEKDNLPTDQGTQAFPLAALPAHLGEPTADYDLVKAYASGILFDGTYYMAAANISLADAADNSATLSNADGYLANVTLAGRTLYKDGAWNTLCLPFSVVLAGSPLEGAEVRTLTSGSVSGSTLNLTFGDAVTELVAGTPYIIKWEKASDYVDDAAHNIVSPVFEGVTIDATERNFDNGMSGDLRVRFLGTYKNSTFSAEDKSILLMGGENTLYYPLGGASIGSCRAYFKIGDDGALLTRQFTDFSITFGEDDESTGLEAKDWEQGARGKEAWYTLDGRRLNGKPSQRGIYIGNGKKIVIK